MSTSSARLWWRRLVALPVGAGKRELRRWFTTEDTEASTLAINLAADADGSG
jgi:hypothetical protein